MGKQPMTTSINIADGVLEINSLEVRDEATVSYVGRIAPDTRVAAVLNCLQIGARALTFSSDKTGATLLADALKSESNRTQSMLAHVSKTAEESVAKSAKTIEKAVGDLLEDLSKDLNRTLDPANTESIIGKLRIALTTDYQRVTAKVREDLDLANPQSPLSAMRSELEKGDERRHAALAAQLAELLQRLTGKDAARAERTKSTRKGSDFEAATFDFLSAESRPRKDLAISTGTAHGLDQNMVGDFVIEINPSDGQTLKIAVECKNAQKNGARERVRELDKAISNRGAAFGISVVTSSGDVTQAITPFGDDKLIVRISELPDGDGWDFTALGVALECARWKALMARSTIDSLDVIRLDSDIDSALAIINSFTEVKKRITAGKTHLDGISEFLDDMKRQLVTVLQRIRETVETAHPKSEAA
jgi:uncharacterized alpha-E superfamily protein